MRLFDLRALRPFGSNSIEEKVDLFAQLLIFGAGSGDVGLELGVVSRDAVELVLALEEERLVVGRRVGTARVVRGE